MTEGELNNADNPERDCPNCYGGKMYIYRRVRWAGVGSPLNYESKPWWGCDDCHSIEEYVEASDE